MNQLYPIIRRVRRPLMPEEPSTKEVAPVPSVKTAETELAESKATETQAGEKTDGDEQGN